MVSVNYYAFSPPVVDENQNKDVVLRAEIVGAPSAVTLQLASTGEEIPLAAQPLSIGPKIPRLWTASLGAADVLYKLTPDDVNRNFVGYLKLYVGHQEVGKRNIIADVMTGTVPALAKPGIRILSPSVQYTDHLVNIWSRDFFSAYSFNAFSAQSEAAIQSVTREFYQHFGDHYDHLDLISAIPFIANRGSWDIKNDVQGIGIQAPDNTALYGSTGRLSSCTMFPLPTFFDRASRDYQHELGHHWINYLPAPLDKATPHWPLSDLASDIMGWGIGQNSQGFTFNYDVVPEGNAFRLVPNNGLKVFSDLSLYLMGLLPANQVGEHFVFDNQNQTPVPWGELVGPVTSVSIKDIVSQLGPRTPDAAHAQKQFRVAAIIISRDGLVPPDMMRLYDWFAARAEATQVVPFSQGLEKGQTNPFFLSTRKLGRLDASIVQIPPAMSR